MLRTLTRKVILAAVVFLVLLGLATAFAITNIRIVSSAVDHLGEDTIEQVKLSNEFNTDLFRAMAEALSFTYTHEPSDHDDAQHELSDARTILATLDTLETKPDPYAADVGAARRELQVRRVALFNALQPRIEDLLRAVDTNDAAAINNALNVLNQHQQEVEQFEEETGVLADRSIAAATDVTRVLIQRALVGAGVSFGLFALLILLVVIGLRRGIIRPVAMVATAADAVAGGNLDQTLRVTSGDEIGALQQAFNQMVGRLRGARQEADEQRQIIAARAAELERTLAELQESMSVRDQLSETVQALSSPVVPVLEGVLVMPLIGFIDTKRATQVLNALLMAIEQQHASFVIMDVTGVPIVDTQVAQLLLQAANAARLLGAQPILVGVRPEVAQTIIGLGLSLSSVMTQADLQSGVMYALQQHTPSRTNKQPHESLLKKG